MSVETTNPILVFITSFCFFPFYLDEFYILQYFNIILGVYTLVFVSASFLWNLWSWGSYWNSII
jgi:hypothetical protein